MLPFIDRVIRGYGFFSKGFLYACISYSCFYPLGRLTVFLFFPLSLEVSLANL